MAEYPHTNKQVPDFQVDSCVICKVGFTEGDPAVNVTRKGILTLIRYSEIHETPELYSYLNKCISTTPSQTVLVHKICRRNFTDPKRNSNVEHPEVPCVKKLRSSLSPFNLKNDCFLCGTSAAVDDRHPERSQVHTVATLPIRDKILDCCDKRRDQWASEVKNRIIGCIDLVAAEAVYHDKCFSRFMLNKEPTISTTKKPSGRPEDKGMLHWFEMLCQWLESEGDAELYTLSELHSIMTDFAENYEVYSVKRLKQKLQEHYKEFVFFADIQGRSNVVCFKNIAKYIINEKWYSDKKENIEDEAERIVTTAGKIIRAEIRERKYDSDVYPTNRDIADINYSSKWVPPYLHSFLKILISSELKQNSIGHSIIQAARPRSVITPTLFGLGVEMDHVFGSKWLINELSRMGFSISYDEVTRYKQSSIQNENLDSILAEYLPGTFTQWVADNVDHNVATIDGKNTFHGMGIIAVSTPKDNTPLMPIPQAIRRQQRMKVMDLVRNKGVPIHQYIDSSEKGLASLTYKPFIQLQAPNILPPELYTDLLWHSGWMFSEASRPRPNWSGFMQHIFSGDQYSVPKSEVLFLPIIDLNPSDETCIYSTLIYVQNQAQKLNIPTPCITFDQPLWYKAMEIITSKSLNIVCRLGGFHTMMSFMGSIGSMMKGSGLEEALETVYGPNAVTHMMSGKAVSRALRGHFLVEAALINKLILEVSHENLALNLDKRDDETEGESEIDQDIESSGMLQSHCTDMEEEIPSSLENKLDASEVEKIRNLYEGVMDKTVPVANGVESQELAKLNELLTKYKMRLAELSPTAKLWLQYSEYVETLKLFIRAERTGNWTMHLIAISRMMNLFAATGHIHYAKSVRLYLQLMQDLPIRHPWLYKCFMEQGFHTVRRSSRYWAGIWTDLAIEQVMMRSIKNRGGLTRGRGVTESVHLQWVYSMHKCAGIHEAMTTLTSLKHNTSEQHIELGASRSQRDFHDLTKMYEWFCQHNPFDLNENKLCSLSSGLTASHGDGVNCDKTEEIGAKIQRRLDDMTITKASIKRSEQVRPLEDLYPGVKVDQQKVHINPDILFSRLIAIVQRQEHMEPHFAYELTAIPTSLFKDSSMRKAAKAQLAKYLTMDVESSERNKGAIYVLDGGALLHRVKWLKKATYKELAMQYVHYVYAKYAHSCIVFDGYEEGPSIKDHEHQRRVGKTCADIHLCESIDAHKNQDIFLSNKKNKTQFISLLKQYFEAEGHIVYVDTSDADTMIVKCALQYAVQGQEVNVVADDTDILILLMYHWNQDLADIYFQSEARKSSKQKKDSHVWKIQDLVKQVGNIVTSNILFIHAWSGCDTTSATFGQGKTSLLKKMHKSKEIHEISCMMNDPDLSAKEIGKAGIKLFVLLYDGKQQDSLRSLRHAKFMEMVSGSKTSLDPQKLPPTERAAYFHSLRVHLQVIIWKKLKNNALDPLEWGWKSNGTVLTPIMTDLDAAPECLLKFIRCKCKLSSKNPCGSNVCLCRKHGLKCVTACGDCRGETCNNSECIIEQEDNTSDEENILLV